MAVRFCSFRYTEVSRRQRNSCRILRLRAVLVVEAVALSEKSCIWEGEMVYDDQAEQAGRILALTASGQIVGCIR